MMRYFNYRPRSNFDILIAKIDSAMLQRSPAKPASARSLITSSDTAHDLLPFLSSPPDGSMHGPPKPTQHRLHML